MWLDVCHPRGTPASTNARCASSTDLLRAETMATKNHERNHYANANAARRAADGNVLQLSGHLSYRKELRAASSVPRLRLVALERRARSRAFMRRRPACGTVTLRHGAGASRCATSSSVWAGAAVDGAQLRGRREASSSSARSVLLVAGKNAVTHSCRPRRRIRGAVLIDGDDVMRLPAHERPVNMYVPALRVSFPHMTVF